MMSLGIGGEAGKERDSAPAPAIAAKLVLSAAPSPSHGDGVLSQALLDKWGKLYGIEHRQCRRWIKRGIEKGEPCPLDDPEKMPAWTEKHIEKLRSKVRDSVNAAAEAARAERVGKREDASESEPTAATPVPTSKASPIVAGLDLTTVGGVEGEAVKVFRTYFAAARMQLDEAYMAGNEDRIRTLTVRLEKIGESLRKHEAAARQRAKEMDLLLEKPVVISDVMAAINTLKRMRAKRVQRVLAMLAGIPPEWAEKLTAALNEVGEREEGALRTIGAFKTPEDVLGFLAA